MENYLTIQNVIGNKDQYNLAIPFLETRQVNPFYKASVSLLTVDVSEQAGQIFKVGSKCVRQGNSDVHGLIYFLLPNRFFRGWPPRQVYSLLQVQEM